MNKERTIVTLLREISHDFGFEFKTYSYDWVKALSKDGSTMYVYGYNFPLNNTCFTQIANDKACTYEILSSNNVPAVEHFYFMSPNDIHYVKYLGVNGNWKQMTALLEKYGKVVVKPNSGTGGAGLKIVSEETELEKAVNDIFSYTSTLCISPYYEIENEFRVIMLESKPRLVFRKVRPYVVGNGKENVALLCAKEKKKLDYSLDIDMSYIPKDGEKFEIGWKHNLGQGSAPETLSGGELYNRITNFATKALSLLGGNFSSVDIVSINGKIYILEINSGVMMDNFANTSPENFLIAKSIYKEAIDIYFKQSKYARKGQVQF